MDGAPSRAQATEVAACSSSADLDAAAEALRDPAALLDDLGSRGASDHAMLPRAARIGLRAHRAA